jgi:hypothetical protein
MVFSHKDSSQLLVFINVKIFILLKKENSIIVNC